MHTCIHRYVHCIALSCIAWHTNVNSAMQCPAIQCNRYIHSSGRISDVTITSPSIWGISSDDLTWGCWIITSQLGIVIYIMNICAIFFRKGPLWAVNFKVLTGFDVIWIVALESPIGCLAGWKQIWKMGGWLQSWYWNGVTLSEKWWESSCWLTKLFHRVVKLFPIGSSVIETWEEPHFQTHSYGQ